MNLMISKILQAERKKRKLSQVDLVKISDVSLPSIQNIEAFKANPTIKTVSQLLNVLGFELNIVPREADWEFLEFCGLPLRTNEKKRGEIFSIVKFKNELITGYNFLTQHSNNQKYARHKEAFEALILALKTHYYSMYKEIKDLIEIDFKNITGKIIKLRRIAIANLSKHL